MGSMPLPWHTVAYRQKKGATPPSSRVERTSLTRRKLVETERQSDTAPFGATHRTQVVSGDRGRLGEGRLGVRQVSWEFRFLPSFPYFLGKVAVQEISGKTPGSPRHPSSRHPRPSDCASGSLFHPQPPSLPIYFLSLAQQEKSLRRTPDSSYFLDVAVGAVLTATSQRGIGKGVFA